jgi:hypothetical protein
MKASQTHGFTRQDQRILASVLAGDLNGRLPGIPHEVVLDPTHGATCDLGIDGPGLNSLGLHVRHRDTSWSQHPQQTK